jgi:hypothetical protein
MYDDQDEKNSFHLVSPPIGIFPCINGSVSHGIEILFVVRGRYLCPNGIFGAIIYRSQFGDPPIIPGGVRGRRQESR